MVRNTREAIQTALAHAYLGNTNTANFTTYLCPIDSSPGNAAYIMANAVQMAKVRAAVNGFKDKNISDFLNYVYGPDVEAMHKQEKQQNLAHTVALRAFNGSYSGKKATRLKQIAWLAVEDARMGILMTKPMPQVQYIEATGIGQNHWYRDGEPFRRKALEVLSGFDKTGVGIVSITVRQICEAESDYTQPTKPLTRGVFGL